MSRYRYGVLGAGRQGTAAAYDLVVHGDARSVAMADLDGRRASAAASRVNHLTGRDVAAGVAVDGNDREQLLRFLEPLDAFIGAASFRLNLRASEAALEARTHMCDLGGEIDVVHRQLELDDLARERSTCLVPDCGEAPGMANNLMAYAVTLLEEPDELLSYDGGLPLHPVPPWNYALTFNVDGLTTEYQGTTTYVIEGELREVECFDAREYELLDFGPPFGTLEAFVAGTASTTPWTLGPSLRTLKSKVLRYPGHAAQFKAFRDAGLFEEAAVTVAGLEVVPREVFHALIEPRIRASADTRDVVLARVICRGRSGGKRAAATVDLRVEYEEELGFTAMEQATGWHAAMVCSLMASGRVEPGAKPVEQAVDPDLIVERLRDRGFALSVGVDAA